MKVVVNLHNYWTLEFLKFMGISSDNVIPSQNQIIFSRLVYLPTPNPCLFANAVQLRGMRSYIHSRLTPVPGNLLPPLLSRFSPLSPLSLSLSLSSFFSSFPPFSSASREIFLTLSLPNQDDERIILFISRQGTQRRRYIVNQDRLIERIQELFPREKIEIFKPYESVPIATHFQQFYRAKIVIGPHGGGFANLIACQEDTKILEITNSWGRNFFIEMTSKLNLEYHMTTGTSQDTSNVPLRSYPPVVSFLHSSSPSLSFLPAPPFYPTNTQLNHSLHIHTSLVLLSPLLTPRSLLPPLSSLLSPHFLSSDHLFLHLAKDSPVIADEDEVLNLVGDMLGQGLAHLRTKENRQKGNELYLSSARFPVCCFNNTWN